MIKKILSILFLATFSFVSAQEQYYDDVDLTLTGLALKDALATKIIATHTRVLDYTGSGPDVWDACKATDENTENTSEVILYYGWEDGSDQDITNDRTRDKNLQDSGGGDTFVWNREHVFPKSLANPPLDTDVPGAATDAHHLRAADRTRNSTRNNRKYGLGSGNSDFSQDTFAGLDGANTNAWYPGDEWKGDAARMIMYMYLRYGDRCKPTYVGVGSNEFTPDDMIDLFLKWNAEDPVSQIEKDRNTYHENTSNSAAQGNRNPFIDNPYLATRIWGGESAEDTWGFYTGSDTEAPTTPTEVALTNVTLTSIDISWTASTDNVEVSGYNIYVNNTLTAQTSNTSATISNLNTNTTYSFTVVARDIINNLSSPSQAVNGTTLEDTEAPSVPSEITISNRTDSSFRVNWSASTDNNAIAGYEVYLDGNLNSTTTNLFYTIIGLNASTTYSVEVLAKDVDDNKSAKSVAVATNTTSGSTGAANELFFSEYVEGNGGTNKALEIVNLTGTTLSLDGYDIRRNGNGGQAWSTPLNLNSGSVKDIIPNDVFVIGNGSNSIAQLRPYAEDNPNGQVDLVQPNNDSTNNGEPVNFNGNDPIGLFKNGVLIDIIGKFAGGSSNSFAENVTLRRKLSVTSPNIGSDENFPEWDSSEWESFPENTVNGIGVYDGILNIDNAILESFKMFPNPTNGNKIYFSVTEEATIRVYNILGKLVKSSEVTKSKNNIDISHLSKGIYLVKINSGKQFITKKLIKN